MLGGKAPHNHGVFVGGVTESLDASKLIQLKYLVSETKAFINNRMLKM